MGIRTTAEVNVPLTSYAYAVMADRLAAYRLANLLCPIVQVSAATGSYKIFDDRNAFLVESFKRPLGGPRLNISAQGTNGTYACAPYGGKTAVDNFEDALNANTLDMAQIKLRSLLSRKAISYAKEVADFVFANLTAVADRGNWSNKDIDPIDQIDEQLDALSKDVGTTENISVIMSVGEWRTLRSNPKVKARLGVTGPLALSRQQLVDGLLFPVNLEISGVAYTATKEGQSSVTKNRVAGGYCVINYSQPNPTTEDPSAFKCFSTSSVLADNVVQWTSDDPPGTNYAVDWSQDIKKTGALCARLLAIT